MIRGVWQMQKLTVRYCAHGGSSTGTRQFLREEAPKFARENPQIQFHASLGLGKHPVVIGSYNWGNDKVIDVVNKSPDEILKVCYQLRNTTGRKVTKIKNEVYGTTSSVQGVWTPDIKYPEMALTHVYEPPASVDSINSTLDENTSINESKAVENEI